MLFKVQESKPGFDEVDVVIAKAQGNYEMVSEVNKDMVFILKAKCPVITGDLGCDVGRLVLRTSSFAKAGVEKGDNYARI